MSFSFARRIQTLSTLAVIMGVTGLLGSALYGCQNETPTPKRADPVGDRMADASRGGANDSSATPTAQFAIRSVTLDARDRPSDAVLDDIAALGTTDITLIPFGFQSSAQTPSIRMHTDGGWYSESTDGIRDLAARAEERGMGVILKPHVWIGRYSAEGQSRHAIGFDTAADWAAWEAEYRTFLMHYARLAQEVDARVLILGSELRRVARERPAFWHDLAGAVRAEYDGDLSYAANWNDDLREIRFWDALDYIGVQAYFPLSENDGSGSDAAGDSDLRLSPEKLSRGWDAHAEMLASVSEVVERPVLFTEIGYRSAPDAASAPWRWPEDAETEAPDPEMQAACYRAFFHRLGDAPWLGGAIVWKWHPEPEGKRPVGFTPQNKPAEEILRQGFGGA